jgi:hypothetical protein
LSTQQRSRTSTGACKAASGRCRAPVSSQEQGLHNR